MPDHIIPGETSTSTNERHARPRSRLSSFGLAFLAYHQGGYNRTKLILRVTSLALSIILIGLSVEDSRRTYLWHVYTDDVPQSVTQSWWSTVPVALIALGLDGLELFLCARLKRNPGVHPGWHIGLELTMWGGLLFTLTFTGSDIGYEYFAPNPPWLQSIKITLVTFLAVMFIIRSILFGFACRDTHRHIKASQLNMIMEALRRRNELSGPSGSGGADPSSTASMIPQAPLYQQAIDLQNQMHGKPAAADPNFYPELEMNQKFLASDFPRRPYNR